MILARPTQFQAGSTLAETLVAATLVGAFFVTIFEVNAICLRYIDASKECVAAVQGVQDRIEGLRNLAFSDLDFTKLYDESAADPCALGTEADFVSLSF